jgi:hypothetical protein
MDSQKFEILFNHKKNILERNSFRNTQRSYVGQYRWNSNLFNKQDYNKIHEIRPSVKHLTYGIHIPHKIPIIHSGISYFREWSRNNRAKEFDKKIHILLKNKKYNIK